MKLQCAELEQQTGMPHTECCWSCREDATAGIEAIDLSGDEIGFGMPEDASLHICCEHFGALEQWRESRAKQAVAT